MHENLLVDVDILTKNLDDKQLATIKDLSEKEGPKCCFTDGPANFYNDFMSADHQVASRMIVYAHDAENKPTDMLNI